MGNDATIIFGFIIFFSLVGAVAPFLNAGISGLDIPENDPTSITEELEQSDVDRISGWRVLLSILTMSLWSFGTLPIWIDAIIFIPIRIIFWFIIVRNIWIGGGA